MRTTERALAGAATPARASIGKPSQESSTPTQYTPRTRRKSKKVYGVGVNDSDTPVYWRENGKLVRCRRYRMWKSMLQRCHDPKFQARNITYISCSVDDVWRSFTAFRDWLEQEQWCPGLEVDKDLLYPGNKVYSPDTCLLVTHALNNLLNDHGAARGPCPQGVHWQKQKRKFRARLSISGKSHHLGYYTDVNAAEHAYVTAKADHIAWIASTTSCNRTAAGLHRHEERFRRRAIVLEKLL